VRLLIVRTYISMRGSHRIHCLVVLSRREIDDNPFLRYPETFGNETYLGLVASR
jgi:hypothetical protein